MVLEKRVETGTGFKHVGIVFGTLWNFTLNLSKKGCLKYEVEVFLAKSIQARLYMQWKKFEATWLKVRMLWENHLKWTFSHPRLLQYPLLLKTSLNKTEKSGKLFSRY